MYNTIYIRTTSQACTLSSENDIYHQTVHRKRGANYLPSVYVGLRRKLNEPMYGWLGSYQSHCETLRLILITNYVSNKTHA